MPMHTVDIVVRTHVWCMGNEIVQPILITSEQESYQQKAYVKGYPLELTQLPEIRVQPTETLVQPGALQWSSTPSTSGAWNLRLVA